MDAERLRHMLIVARDVDDANESENQLKAEFEKDESVLFCITTRYGLFRHLSAGFTCLLGWENYETNVITWHSLIHTDDLVVVTEFLARMEIPIIVNEVPLYIRTRVRHRSGIYVSVNLWVVGWTRTGMAYTAGELADVSDAA